jgi:APA family basic amino acid/polyamine antiporter
VGVLTTCGYTVAAAGSNQIMLGLWLVGGMIARCGALTLAELSAALSASGGEHIYLFEAYGPVVAFLSRWVSFMIGFAASIAAPSFAAASYMLAPFGLRAATDRVVIKGCATLAILAFSVIHSSGGGRVARVHSAVTLLKMGVLASLLVAGMAMGWRRGVNLVDRPQLDIRATTAMIFSLVDIIHI